MTLALVEAIEQVLSLDGAAVAPFSVQAEAALGRGFQAAISGVSNAGTWAVAPR
jgi:hypothetical protein